jgi:hypothetical protein
MTTLTLDTPRVSKDVQEELRRVEPVDRDEHGDALPYEKFTTEEAWQRAEDQASLDARMREKLERRAALAARARAIAYRTYRVVLWVVLFACLLALAATTLYVYKDRIVTQYDKFGMDTRSCISKVGERTITGTRTYSYRYMTVLGHKIFMTPENEVQQETRIDVSGNGMTILGTKADGTVDKTMISDGEKFRQLLKPAETYTFFMDGGKNTAVIAYNELCK